jgi:hypothetical protein
LLFYSYCLFVAYVLTFNLEFRYMTLVLNPMPDLWFLQIIMK